MSVMLSQGISIPTSVMESFINDNCIKFLSEDGFYTVPNDIWQHLQLLPTPPLSPDRESKQSTDSYEIDPEDFDIGRFDIDHCDTDFEELLKSTRDMVFNGVSPAYSEPDTFQDGEKERERWTNMYEEENCCRLKSGLLHDCMWCGPFLSKPNNLKCGSFCEMENDSHIIVHPPTACGLTVNTSFNQPQRVVTDLQDYTKQDVDPCVFPYTPLNDHSYHHQPTTNGSGSDNQPMTNESESDNFGSETPSDSGIRKTNKESVYNWEHSIRKNIEKLCITENGQRAHKPEAEIDVVTVPECHQPDSLKRPGRRKLGVQIKNGTPPKPLKLTLTLSNGKVISRKSGGQKRALEIESNGKFFPSKKCKLNSNASESKKSMVCGQSPCSSDSEDIEKRSQHNSMERKRRNDLKSLFQDLRVSMEELRDNVKASKVLILKTARRIIIEDVHATKQYQNFTAKLLRKNETLKRRLLSLQRYRQ